MTSENEQIEKEKNARKAGLWFFDPSVFQPLPRTGFIKRHLQGPLRSLGKFIILSLALAYPVLLVAVGIVYGGIAFWSVLLVSVGLMWLVISKAGYARNFAGWGESNKRFLGLLVAIVVVVAFYYGFINVRDLFLPIFGIALVSALVVGLKVFSQR